MAARRGLTQLIMHLKADDWISPLIDRVTSSRSAEHWDDPDVAIHPSGLGSECELYVQFGMLGHRQAVESHSQRRFDTGTDAGQRWVQRFRAAGMLVDAERYARMSNPIVKGSMDLIVQHPVTSELYVGEVKTTNSQSYKKLPKTGGDPKATMRLIYAVGGFYRKYCLQLTTYMRASGLRGFFLFENKDTQEYRVLYVEPDDAMKEEAYGEQSKAVLAQRASMRGELIPHPFEINSFICRNCDRREFCNKVREGDAEAVEFIQARLQRVKHDTVNT